MPPESLSDLSRDHEARGDLAAALPMADRAIADLRRSPADDRAALVTCLSARSEIHGLRRDAQAQLKDAQEAVALLDERGVDLVDRRRS